MTKIEVEAYLAKEEVLFYAIMEPYYMRVGGVPMNSWSSIRIVRYNDIASYGATTLRMTDNNSVAYCRLFRECWRAINYAFNERIAQLEQYKGAIEDLNARLVEEADGLGYLDDDDGDGEDTAVMSRRALRI